MTEKRGATTKRPRRSAKPKTGSKAASSTEKKATASAKKVAAPKKSAGTKKKASSRSTRKTEPVISQEQRHQMIQEAAYFIAAQRCFVGGDPMQDWLSAEETIDQELVPLPKKSGSARAQASSSA